MGIKGGVEVSGEGEWMERGWRGQKREEENEEGGGG